MAKLHVDVDPGCDDAVMTALALSAPALDVVGMSTVGGNTTVENATHNALGLLELFDRTDVPVARGAARPLAGTFDTAEWVHGPDGIRGDLPEPTTDTVDQHGAQFIVDQARTHEDDLTIAAVGPLTNLATALVLEPDLPDLVDEIYLMGGAALSAGNKTPMAEANFHNDPVAARRVVRTTEPRLVGLDATYEATLPADWVDRYAGAGQPHESVAAWLDFPAAVRRLTATPPDPAVHDAAPVAHCIDDQVLEFEPYHLDVDTSGGPSDGAVICDARRNTDHEPNAEVAVSTDTDRFRAVVERALDRL